MGLSISNIVTGSAELRLWCERCLTPARYRVPVHIISDDGVDTLGWFDLCNRCDDERTTP